MRFSFVPIQQSVSAVAALISKLGLVKIGVTAAVLGAGAVVLIAVSAGDDTDRITPDGIPAVSISSVEDLSRASTGLPLLGRVRSESEALVRTEAQGIVTRLNYKLGDTVAAGAIIAELENASERAAVEQARAALDEVLSESGRSQATIRTEALNAYRSAYIAADDAINNKTEPFFINDRSQFPVLTVPISGGDSIEEGRAEMTELVRAWERELDNLPDDPNMLALVGKARSNLDQVEKFLNELASAANRRTGDDSALAVTDTDRTNLLSARSSISTKLATLVSIEDTLRQTLIGTSGGTGEQDAQEAAARAQVNAALATLEMTIIRAPISGTINALYLERGNFIGTNAEAVAIANNAALKIEAFVTASDKSHIAVGNPVTIDGRFSGIVTNIAPGLDPLTNKLKVEIGVEDTAPTLTHGDSVRVSVERNSSKPLEEIIIPITALKVETDRIVVFSVTDDQTLYAHEVTEGPLVGGNIVIFEGLSPDMEIVLDARGLNEGDRVEILQ